MYYRIPGHVYRLCRTALLLISGHMTAQLPDHYVKLLTEHHGLQPAEFIHIARDSSGYVWLLSQNKVQQFDGQVSRAYAVPANTFETYIDPHNRRWVLSRKQLHRFENTHKGLVPSLEAPEDQNIICMFYDHAELYVVLTSEIHKYDETTGAFRPVALPFVPAGIRFSSVYARNEEYLFLSSTERIYSIHLPTKTVTSMPFPRIAGLTALSGNTVFASNTRLKSFYLHLDKNIAREITSIDFTPALENDFIRVYSGVRIDTGTFHVSTSRGIMKYDMQSGTFTQPSFYHRGEKLNNTLSVRSLCIDQEGIVYMSHADGLGLYHTARSAIHYIRNYTHHGVSLPEMDIRSFAEDTEGNIWIATLNGLAQLNIRNGQIETYLAGEENSFEYPSIRHLLFYHNHLWVGTSGKGIWLYQPNERLFTRPLFDLDSTAASLNGEFIWCIRQLRNQHVFIAAGNYCYDISPDFQVRRLNDTVFAGISRTAVQDSTGRMWHGTASGLNVANEDYKLLFRLRDTFPDRRIISLCEWKKNHMLIGTKGLFQIVTAGDSIRHISEVSSFTKDRFVFAIEKDQWGKVWIGTDEGLFRYTPESGEMIYFGIADNVQPQAFNSNALYASPSGWIFGGGKSGMNFFQPEFVRPRIPVLCPQLAAVSFGANDSIYFSSAPPYNIPFWNRSISLEISAPDFEQPYLVQYRYKLNAEAPWIENGHSRNIRLHNLDPGKYQLFISASHDRTTWYDSDQTTSFYIQKPWWHQMWFYSIMLVLVSGAVYFTWVTLLRRRRQKKLQEAIDYFANSEYENATTDHILWDIAHNCISRMDFEECVIYLVDTKRNMLVQKAAYGPKNAVQFEIENPLEIPIGQGITGYVAQSGIAEIIPDTTKDPRYLIDDINRQSEITVPILFNGTVIGIIDSEHSRRHFFNQDHLQTLTTIAGICSVKIARRISLEEMQKAEALVRELNTRMLETKYTNLRLQMNPHFLFNCLSSIQHLIVSQQTYEAYTYLTIFSSFLRSVLQVADHSVITLEEEIRMLELYVKLERLGSDKAFHFSIEVEENLETEDVLIPPLMIQPIIENAIWHGLLPKEGDKNLRVSFRNEADLWLICVIEDDGIGRLAAQSKRKETSAFGHQSMAMDLIHKRLQLLQEKTGKPASFQVEDKMIQGVPAGTRVTITLPFYNPGEL